MLFREIRDVFQPPGDLPRRWFTNEYFDLIVWFEKEDRKTLFGFQLCYDIANDEHSLTWKKDEGFRHNTVDNGQTSRDIKKSSILVPDGAFPYKVVLDRFLEGVPLEAKNERALFVTVFDMIIEFGGVSENFIPLKTRLASEGKMRFQFSKRGFPKLHLTNAEGVRLKS